MHYYIDGYNLLFRTLHAGDDLKTQRKALIENLGLKINLLELDVTLVFDSHYQPDEGSRSHLKLLEIVFTPAGETADELILQELKEARTPTQETVVTSDKKLAWLCRRRLAKTMSVEEFLTWINKRCKNKQRVRKAETPKLLPSPPKPPAKTPTPEGSFDYYLNTFEKVVAALPTPKPSKEPKKIKKQMAPPPPKQESESDDDRWLRLFT